MFTIPVKDERTGNKITTPKAEQSVEDSRMNQLCILLYLLKHL